MSLLIWSILLWYVRMFVSGLLCILIGFVGIAVLDRITVGVKEFNVIRQDAEATALFVGGFLLFIGIVIHGTALNPIVLSQALLDLFFQFLFYIHEGKQSLPIRGKIQ